jgi:ammonium transporter, Amt family
VDTGDTAFILVCAALVMFMTPGLAMFYGGMVRSKNVLGTVMQSFFALGLVSVLWVLIGYTLAFGPSQAGLIGGLGYIGFSGVGAAPNPEIAPTIPHVLFAVFQMMFAVITPALITGAFAERMKFSAYVAFTALWLVFVYAPLAHWVWGGGWIGELGALDFAGGTVVHINAGIAALIAAVLIGKRKGFGKEAIVPHNLTLTVLGAGILWFGWFGFNAGSALAADGVAMTFAAADVPYRRIVSTACAEEGIEVAAWRAVPVDERALGPQALASLPVIEQALQEILDVISRPERARKQKREAALVAKRRTRIPQTSSN